MVTRRRWREAHEAAISRDDVEPFRKLLLSEPEFDLDARNLLADILARRTLTRPKGRPHTPIYRQSDIERRIASAKRGYRMMRKAHHSKEWALERAASTRKIGVEVLEAALDHTRGRPKKKVQAPLETAHMVQPWVKAAKAFDENGDITPLIDMLRGKAPSSELVHHLFADLLKRYRLAEFRGSTA